MLPLLTQKIYTNEKNVSVFGGLNLTESVSPGELCHSINTTGDFYPSLGISDAKKKVFETERTINSLFAFGGWVCTSYTNDKTGIFLTYDGIDYEYTSYSSSDDFSLPRKIASLSDSLIIIPDNVIFHTNTRSFSKICVSEKSNPQSARDKFSREAPDSDFMNHKNITYIAILKHNSLICRKDSYQSGKSYDFYYTSFDKNLKEGDVITLKGSGSSPKDSDYPEFYSYEPKLAKGFSVKIKSVTSTLHETPAGTVTEITEIHFDDHSIDMGGFSSVYMKNIHIERGIPALTHICSRANRIWGTSGKEIYTSKLSDASEWNDFTSDSYGTMPYACFNTSCETEGDFNAIIPFENYVFAFKGNTVHKVYGDEPDEYTVYAYAIPGIDEKNSETLAVCSDSMIYVQGEKVYLYKNNYPSLISQNLERVQSALSAAATAEKYYLLTENGDEKLIYVYDRIKKQWHVQKGEDESMYLCSYSNKIFEAGGNEIYELEAGDEESKQCWEFCVSLTEKSFGKKMPRVVSVRYSLEKGAYFTLKCICDGTKSEVCHISHDEKRRTDEVVFIPKKRCTNFSLEFKGKGKFILNAVKLKFYRGSEI